jgi:hypothetical protein
MTIIHMDTDLVRNFISNIRAKSKDLEFGWRDLFVATSQLNWEGHSRDEMVDEMRYGGRKFYEVLEKMNELADALGREVDEWENKAQKFALRLGPTNEWLNKNANEWGENVWIDSSEDTRLTQTFAWFSTTEEGRRLIAAAISAGLMFVIMKDGVAVGWLGAPGGKVIPINWETMEGASGYYSPDIDDPRIGLNERMKDDSHIFQHTLAHEMTHAIDLNTENLNQQALNDFNNLDGETVKGMPIENVESIMEKGLEEYVKTEINAHGIGYEMDPGFELGDLLINNDGEYSYSEKAFILNVRGYEEHYEDSLNQWLKEVFGDNTKYRANVWLDVTGKVRVDLDQGVSLIPQILK